MVGALAAGECKQRALIVCTSEVAAEQWRDELRRCTTAVGGSFYDETDRRVSCGNDSISLFTTHHKLTGERLHATDAFWVEERRPN